MNSILRNKVPVKIKRLSEDAIIPRYAHESDAGFDLVAIEDTIIAPGETVLIKTGIAVAIPDGYQLSIRPRSGITVKTKLRVAYGTLDAGYIGELGVMVDNIVHPSYVIVDKGWETFEYEIIKQAQDGVLLPNGEVDDSYEYDAVFDEGTYLIPKGTRIAQAVISEAPAAVFTEVDSLDETERGANGYGSTGVKEGE